MMKLKDYSILFLLISLSLDAQYKVFGSLKDSYTQRPLQGVELFLDEVSALSNAEGFYQFNSVERGTYQLSAYVEGYQLFERKITVDRNERIDIVLEREQSLSTLEIRVLKKKVFNLRRMKDVEGTTILAGKKNEVVLVDQLTANLATNNARQIYSQVVGLNIVDYNDGGLQLGIGGRGLDPNRTANFNTRQNGYDISADVLGYPESYYTPPAEALKEIQIIRGAASLQYGTQFGGLINFKFKEPKKNDPFEFTTRNTVGSYDLFTTFNSISGTKGKLGYYAFANYKTGNSFRPNSDFKSYNYFGHLQYQLTTKTRLSAELTHFSYLAHQPGGLSDEQFYKNPNYSNRSRNWFDVDWNLLNIKLDHEFVNKAKFSTQFFGLKSSRKALGFRPNRISEVDDPTKERDLIIGKFNNWGVESKYLQPYTLGRFDNVFLIGAKYYHAQNSQEQGPGTKNSDADFSFDYTTSPDYPYQTKFDYPNRNLSLFGETIWNINKKFSITPGFRYEWIKTSANGVYKDVVLDLAGNPVKNVSRKENIDNERSLLLLGLGLSYKYNEALELYGNISQNYRSVTFTDIHTTNPNFQVSPDITDEEGYTFDLGFRGRYDNYLSFDANGFMLVYDNRIGEYDSRDINQPRVRDNIGKALTYGVESFIDFNVARIFNFASNRYNLHYFLNTTLTNSEYKESKLNPVIKGKRVEFVPKVNIRTGLEFGYKNLSANLLWTYISKQYTDATNAEASTTDKNSGILGDIPTYQILDFSASYKYRKYTLEAGVNNLLNRSYFVRRASGYPGPGIIPSNPRTYYLTLGITL